MEKGKIMNNIGRKCYTVDTENYGIGNLLYAFETLIIVAETDLYYVVQKISNSHNSYLIHKNHIEFMED